MAGRYLATSAAVRPECDSTMMRPACNKQPAAPLRFWLCFF